MRVVYVAGKFRGKNSWEIHNNVLKAEKAVVDLIGKGYAPIAPHLITANLQGLYPDKVFLDMCIDLLKKADAIYLLKGWQDSEGSVQEWIVAQDLGMEIIFETEEENALYFKREKKII